ncbi:MAG: hypothetical protein WC627_05325 [Legionella sp.]|jgi:hypothetical protein
MPYIAPKFSVLKANTLNLDTELSTIYVRYSIPKLSEGISPNSTFELLQTRMNVVVHCKETERQTAREVFTQLIKELNLAGPDEEQKKQGTMILLGALLHRYFRMIREIDKSNYYSSVFFQRTPLTSDLFQAIREALGLEKNPGSDYLRKDLERLDALTIVSSLEVFRDNMYVILQKTGRPRYKSYPHFANDINFERHLQDIIDEHAHNKKNQLVLSEFKAVYFLQSFSKQIELERDKLEAVIKEWAEALESAHKDFNSIISTDIIQHIDSNVANEPMKARLKFMVQSENVRKHWATFNHKTFLERMIKCADTMASYQLFGAYSLLLNLELVSDPLKCFMLTALEYDLTNNTFSDADHYLGIKFLGGFIKNNPDFNGNWSIFGSKGRFESKIKTLETKLYNKINEVQGPKRTPESSSNSNSI